MSEKEIKDCPFCEGDIGGCCFCDHSGKIHIGEGEFFKTIEQTKSIGVSFLKEYDKDGGVEIWPEMIEYFALHEENVPKYFQPLTSMTSKKE